MLNVKYEEELVAELAVLTAVVMLSSPSLALTELEMSVCVDDDVEP